MQICFRRGAEWTSGGLRFASRRSLSGVSRFQGPDKLSDAQKTVLEEIHKSRTTGIQGPFGPWLANAELAQAAQTLGRIVRYETSLTLRESELVILTTAQHYKSATEWNIHVGEARRAGLEEALISKIERDEPIEAPERESILHTFSRELLKTSHVSDEMYNKMRKEFSEKQMVETVSIIGYYGFVALTLNTFHIGK